jgi:hypothetical protein
VVIPQEEAEFERSVHQLDALLQGCEVSPARAPQLLHGLQALFKVVHLLTSSRHCLRSINDCSFTMRVKHCCNYLQDAFDLPTHERSQSALSAVLQLVQSVPLLSALCPAAQQFIAAHAKLLVLSDAVELPT